jgi:hypothetical protein
VRVSRLLDQTQLFLRKVEVRNNPDSAVWLASMQQAVKDRTIIDKIEQQQTPEEIVDEWRQRRASASRVGMEGPLSRGPR